MVKMRLRREKQFKTSRLKCFLVVDLRRGFKFLSIMKSCLPLARTRVQQLETTSDLETQCISLFFSVSFSHLPDPSSKIQTEKWRVSGGHTTHLQEPVVTSQYAQPGSPNRQRAIYYTPLGPSNRKESSLQSRCVIMTNGVILDAVHNLTAVKHRTSQYTSGNPNKPRSNLEEFQIISGLRVINQKSQHFQSRCYIFTKS